MYVNRLLQISGKVKQPQQLSAHLTMKTSSFAPFA